MSKIEVTADEIWRPIPGYEGWYEASNIGNVRSLPRTTDRAGIPVRLAGRVLRQSPSGKAGIPAVTLCRLSKRFTAPVSVLMMLAFVGPCPRGLWVCHENGNAGDNRIENLRYGTPKSNTQDAIRHGTWLRGERSKVSKLREADVIEIRRLYAAGRLTQKEIGRRFGVDNSHVSEIVRRVEWAHI